jgi:hypothetical protein
MVETIRMIDPKKISELKLFIEAHGQGLATIRELKYEFDGKYTQS